MSKTMTIDSSAIVFETDADAKVTVTSDGASSIRFTGDDNSEPAMLKNTMDVANHATATTSPYTVAATAVRIGVRNSGGANPFYVDLPAISGMTAGRSIRIKDETRTAATYPIIIRANGSDTIDVDFTSVTMNTAGESHTLYVTDLGWSLGP